MPNVKIQAIETEYAGCRFRSRLEARWAVAFDNLGVRWQYEPEGLDINGVHYLPDFVLPDMGCMTVEVKGCMAETDVRKVLALARSNPVLVLGEIPRPGDSGPDFLLFVTTLAYGLVARHVSFAPYWGGWSVESGGQCQGPDDPDRVVEWALGLFDSGHSACDEIRQSEEAASAFTAARSARFEHGETPRGTA